MLPPLEAAAVRAAYAEAAVILEYGSGGSTVMAAEMAEKVIFSVESNRRWLRAMKDWFTANPPASTVHLHWADIGPTRRWGHPKDETAWRRFADYPLAVWDLPGFMHPDVVLIDGRFRAGCLLATALRILRPVVVLFDDYHPRRSYKSVERFLTPAAMIGRMARFEVAPLRLDMADLRHVIALMHKPL